MVWRAAWNELRGILVGSGLWWAEDDAGWQPILVCWKCFDTGLEAPGGESPLCSSLTRITHRGLLWWPLPLPFGSVELWRPGWWTVPLDLACLPLALSLGGGSWQGPVSLVVSWATYRSPQQVKSQGVLWAQQ